MHETQIFKNIFRYLNGLEKESRKRISKIYVSLSEFGGLSQEHFRAHYKETASGTKWENLDIEISAIPFGPELEITKIDFAATRP